MKENTLMVTIPADLDTWNPTDVTAWLDGLQDDPEITDAEFARAQNAVNTALLSA